MAGPVERAIRSAVASGDRLTTPVRGAPFTVGDIDAFGVVLLFGKGGHRTPMPWECLEGVARS